MKRLHATMKDDVFRSAGSVHGPVSLNATAAIEDCTPPNVSSRRIEATAGGRALRDPRTPGTGPARAEWRQHGGHDGSGEESRPCGGLQRDHSWHRAVL